MLCRIINIIIIFERVNIIIINVCDFLLFVINCIFVTYNSVSFQVWIYEHFPIFRPSEPLMTWSPSQPWAHRWRPDRPVEKTTERLREYRMILIH